jgi:hypothetical protein
MHYAFSCKQQNNDVSWEKFGDRKNIENINKAHEKSFPQFVNFKSRHVEQ